MRGSQRLCGLKKGPQSPGCVCGGGGGNSAPPRWGLPAAPGRGRWGTPAPSSATRRLQEAPADSRASDRPFRSDWSPGTFRLSSPFLAILDRGMPQVCQAGCDPSFILSALACGPLLRPHLPFLGPAGVPAEGSHRPLALSGQCPESLTPFLLITSSPCPRIREGSLAGR